MKPQNDSFPPELSNQRGHMLSLQDLTLIESAWGADPFTILSDPNVIPQTASSEGSSPAPSDSGSIACEAGKEVVKMDQYMEITPRNSNDEEDEDWPAGVPKITMPKLSSDLAQHCSLHVSISEAIESRWLGPPPVGPMLQSALGKRCQREVSG